MNKPIIHAVATLVVAIFLTSCEKDQNNTERAYYQIDTLFYEPIDISSFFISQGFDEPNPISKDGFTYFMAEEDSLINDGDILYKVDEATGEIAWRWSEYLPGARNAKGLSLHSGQICVSNLDHAYIINSETGTLSHAYTPPSNHTIGGAALFQDKLYVSLTNTRQVSLIEMNIDGSNEKLIHSANGIAKRLQINEGSNFYQISYAVATGDSYSGNGSVFYALSTENLRFKELATGRLPFAGYPHYITDEMNVFSLSRDYLLSGFNLNLFYPMVWSQIVKGRYLYQNDKNLYVTDPDIYILKKESGQILAHLPHQGGSIAVNNEVMIRKEGGLRLCDPASGKVLQTIATTGHITIFHLQNGEFFFGEYIYNGQSRIGKLRITRIQ